MVVDADVPCIKCGYNLRALPFEGLCPECGCSTSISLDAWYVGQLQLHQRDFAWLQSLYESMWLFAIATALIVVVRLSPGWLLVSRSPQRIVMLGVECTWWVLWWYAIWKFARLPHDRFEPKFFTGARIVARVTSTTYLSLPAIAHAFASVLNTDRLEAIFVASGLVCSVVTMLVVSRIAYITQKTGLWIATIFLCFASPFAFLIGFQAMFNADDAMRVTPLPVFGTPESVDLIAFELPRLSQLNGGVPMIPFYVIFLVAAMIRLGFCIRSARRLATGPQIGASNSHPQPIEHPNC